MLIFWYTLNVIFAVVNFCLWPDHALNVIVGTGNVMTALLVLSDLPKVCRR